MFERLSPHSAYIVPILLLGLFASRAFSQSNEKPKLKDFGSSLKRLKWDTKLNATVETKRREDRSASSNDDVVRVETSLVVSDVLVLDQRGQPVNGLTANDFVVTEEGKPQKVGMFSLGDNATVPRSIVLIIDYSCAQLPFLHASVEAAKTLIDKLGPKDRMAIVTDDIELLASYTDNKKKLKQKLDELKKRTVFDPGAFLEGRSRVPFGRGFQYSALMAVLKEAFDDEDERPVIIFQTSGDEARILRNSNTTIGIPPGLPPDLQVQAERNLRHFQQYIIRNPREFSLNDVYRATEKSRATIYAIVPGLRMIGLTPEEKVTQMRVYLLKDIADLDLQISRRQVTDYLNRATDETLRWDADELGKLQSDLALLSTITGGWIEFLDQPSQAEEIYSRIFSDMNRRYLVGYYPTNKEHDGKRRKVNVSVRDHPEFIVMGRKAYYAPGQDQ